MKITFLGTAAAEGIPSPFCNCDTCNHAREHKGRNIRKRQTVLINEDFLIDMGPDLYASCAEQGISLLGVKYALITHSHKDHFTPQNLGLRARPFRLATELPQLKMAAGPSVLTIFDTSGVRDADAEIQRVPILPGRHLNWEPYTIDSIEASHNPNIGDAMNYIINDGNKKVLFASDTGPYNERAWNQIKGHHFDVVVTEATLGHHKGKIHLGFDDVGEMIDKMRELGAVSEKTWIFATHFSHQQVAPHEEIERTLGEMGITCAYDGLTVEV